MQPTKAPLTPEELDELDNALAHPSIVEKSMDASMLHGYLTALAVGPLAVPADSWLAWVWDCDDGKVEPQFATAAEREHVVQLIMRMHDDVTHVFASAPENYEPVWETWDNSAPDNWCRGFLMGIGLHEDDWQALIDEHGDWLAPFLILAEEEGEGEDELEGMTDEQLEEYYGDLFDQSIDSVLDIHTYWLPRRRAGATGRTVRREEPKVGRNDPCTCGSGKKYKNCCGAS